MKKGIIVTNKNIDKIMKNVKKKVKKTMYKKQIEYTGQPAKNKLKRLQIKANKLYRGMIDAIQDINDATKCFYEKSSNYAKALKKIEDELKK